MTGHRAKLLFAIVIVFVSFWFKNILQSVWDTYTEFPKVITNGTRIKVFTQEELSQYNGNNGNIVYLAVLGKVFDVTKGSQHYAKGSPYNYFTGKDGSRALITGDFYDESKNKDHVLDLKCGDIFTLLRWQETFKEKYSEIGILDGRYYDNIGHETSYLKELHIKIDQCKVEKETARKKELEYPPCNIAWSAEDGTKVWCTKTSGGISRNWVGVPRQLFTPGEDKPRCVCINLETIHTQGLIKEYKNCQSEATSCFVQI
ncbi:hypothetical protein K1T71_004085 [Dendrolimus kikuchii]|uniref:Uncharacterized protein n=1 Tax=Dendrolimus kikuchii TaxID=765133 RepID=A0ACC1DA57_9NEOP|nr:hypothetical protein K1T71_004085 [Dendrolimus kikuchii]